jgi:hypothetical protein
MCLPVDAVAASKQVQTALYVAVSSDATLVCRLHITIADLVSKGRLNTAAFSARRHETMWPSGNVDIFTYKRQAPHCALCK